MGLALLLVLAGAAGTVLPMLPGVPLVFLGLLTAAWSDGFDRVGAPTLVVLGLLTALSFAVDATASALGARRVGASWQALAGAAAGSIVGLFFGLPGLLLGPFVGAFAGEWLARRDLRQAGRAGFGTWLGLVVAAAGKIALVFAMVGIFALAWIF
jgi:hypothetical protein